MIMNTNKNCLEPNFKKTNRNNKTKITWYEMICKMQTGKHTYKTNNMWTLHFCLIHHENPTLKFLIEPKTKLCINMRFEPLVSKPWKIKNMHVQVKISYTSTRTVIVHATAKEKSFSPSVHHEHFAWYHWTYMDLHNRFWEEH